MPFCPSCGKRVTAEAAGPACPRCGTSAREGAKYCPACGLEFGAAPRVSHPAAVAAKKAPPSPYALALIDESGKAVGRYPIAEGETHIGREGAELEFSEDVFMSPLHVKLTVREGQIWARDLGSRNGAWLFIAEPHRLVDGDRILVGSQLLLYRRLGYPGPHPPERDATRRMGSLVPSADIACVTQIRSDGSERDMVHLSPGRNVRIGREQGDWVFPYDPSMSSYHAEIQSEDADFVMVDAGSRNGVAVAIRGEVELRVGSRFLVGDKMLRIEKA